MRSKIFIAVVATAIAMSSCDWFTAKKQPVEAFNIEGRWKVDSMSNAGYSIKEAKNVTNPLFSHKPGSVQTLFEFKKDTVVAIISGKPDTLSYKIDNRQIAFKSIVDTASQAYSFTPINDSLISFTDPDSSLLILKRTK